MLQLAEYGLLALVLSGVALALGSGIAWAVMTQMFEFDWLPDWPRVHALATGHANLYATVGTHPDYPDTVEPDVATLVGLAAREKVVAIGETGLDYYRLKGDLGWQRERFRTHIRAAREAGKPLVAHAGPMAASAAYGLACAADRILVIQNGKITEEGTHKQLLRKKGYYYNLYTNQFKDEQERSILTAGA